MTGRRDKYGKEIKSSDWVISYNNIPQEVKIINGVYKVGSKNLSEINVPITDCYMKTWDKILFAIAGLIILWAVARMIYVLLIN